MWTYVFFSGFCRRETVNLTFASYGIMSSRFRCLRRPIGLSPENTTKVIKAAVVLHNFFLSQLGQQHAFAQSEEGIFSSKSAVFSRLKSQSMLKKLVKFVKHLQITFAASAAKCRGKMPQFRK